MTLEEFDKALEKTGLDLSNPPDMEARNMVLAMYGRDILAEKPMRCSRCWMRDNGKCSQGCELYGVSEDPVEAAKQALTRENNVQMFQFMCMYMVPVYERLTDRTGTMDEIRKTFKRMWRKKLNGNGK